MGASVSNLRPWQKGQVVNPGGKSKRVREFEAALDQKLRQGADLLEFAQTLMTDPDRLALSDKQRADGIELAPETRLRYKVRAFAVLMDRYYGRAPAASIDEAETGTTREAFDVRKLSDAQLRALTEALEAGKAG